MSTQQICRLCGMDHANGVELFSGNSEKWDKLVLYISEILQLTCSPEDCLPNWLCAPCQVEAQSTQTYLCLVLSSQEKFDALLKEVTVPFDQEALTSDIKKTKTKCQKIHKKQQSSLDNNAAPVTINKAKYLTNLKRVRRAPKRYMDEQLDIHKYNRPTTIVVEPQTNFDNKFTSNEWPPPIAELRSRDGDTLAKIIEIETAKPNTFRLRYICDYCRKVFTLQKQLTQHLKTHFPDTAQFPDVSNVEVRHQQHNKVLSETAAINIVVGCNGQITSIDTSLNELQSISTNSQNAKTLSVQNKNDYFACLQCHKTYERQYPLHRHYRQVHLATKNQYQCSVCAACFKYASNLDYHMAKHENRKQHVCTICSKSFTLRYELKRHNRIHTGEQPYKCSECNKRFAHHSNLVVHRRIHTGARPFQCTDCSARFNSSSHFKKHQTTHWKQLNSIKCASQIPNGNATQFTVQQNNDSCTETTPSNTTFINKQPLNGNNTAGISLLKRNQVKLLPFIATTDSELNAHKRIEILSVEKLPNANIAQMSSNTAISTQKSNQSNQMLAYKHRCQQCRQYFKQKSALTKHLRTHSGDKPYRCPHCPKSFADPSNFKKHKILHKNAAKALNDVKTTPLTNTSLLQQLRQQMISPTASIVSDPDPDGLEILERRNNEVIYDIDDVIITHDPASEDETETNMQLVKVAWHNLATTASSNYQQLQLIDKKILTFQSSK